ncbi:MAG: DegV family protein [Spirochaetes bacterium]|nr:DegV family protein [Spirochaetota bacterium]
MKIAYLDGLRLRRAILAGSRSIIVNADELNAINVFPVPDGDTGTNMASTAKSIAVSLNGVLHKDVGSVLRQAARSALEGARGNSGAILAQFLQGLAHELGSEMRIGAKRLAQAAVSAAAKTKAALTSPRDGTILTVLDDWACALCESASHSDDILNVFLSGFEAAKASLERTRYILPEMRKAGVVDAGAKGFVHFLDGMADLLKLGKHGIRRLASESGRLAAGFRERMVSALIPAHPSSALPETGDPEGPRFCTEALVQGSAASLDSIRDGLASMGNSVVVAGDEEMMRIHVHSDKPAAVFDFLESIGSVEQHKVDDMELQRRLAARLDSSPGKKPFTIVTDTGCDLPTAFMLEHGIIQVPALITIDGITRPDGPALDLGTMHARMEKDPGFNLSTSQPTDAAFGRAFSLALSYADEALYIGLTSAMSGTFQAGKRVAEAFGGRIRCLDSKSITAGQGALVAFAAGLAESGTFIDEALPVLDEKSGRTELFVAIKDLRSLIRSGRLHGIKSLVLRKFGLKPLLGTDRTGKAESRGLYIGERNGVPALFAKIRKLISKGRAESVHIVHVAARKEAEKLAALCRTCAGSTIRIHVSDMGPLLASIGWLGAVGIAILPRK